MNDPVDPKKTELMRRVSPESFLRTFPTPRAAAPADAPPEFRIVPAGADPVLAASKRWRVILSPVEHPDQALALEIAGDIVLGSSPEPDAGIDVNLAGWQGEDRGVSLRHVLLRPSREKLFVIDLGSTNATHLNGALLTTERVQALQPGDLLTLGRLHVRVKQAARVED